MMIDSKIKWLGYYPSNWSLKKIKFCLIPRNEKNYPIKTNNILSLTAKQGVVPLEEKEGGGNKPKQDFQDYLLAYPGDIVMNSMNILSGSVGLSNYFGCVSPVYYMLRPISKDSDVRFFNYIFQTTQFQKSLFGLGNGILIKESGNGKLNTIRMRIPLDKFGNLYIPVAPPKIQKTLSNYLDKTSENIGKIQSNLNKQIQLLQQYKESLISEIITCGLDNRGIVDSGIFYVRNMSEGWTLTKIGYICKKMSRPFSNFDQPLICSNQGKVIVRPDNVTGLMVSEDNAMQGIKRGDIAIHGMDTWHGAIALSDFDGKITRVVHVCTTNQDARFIVYYLQHLAYQNVYKLISNGVRGNTSDFRSWNKVKEIYIPIPNLYEQKKICDYLDKKCELIDRIIFEKQSQVNSIEEMKKSLIYEYITGKKEVPNE